MVPGCKAGGTGDTPTMDYCYDPALATQYVLFTIPPLFVQWGKIDFVCLTLPGTCIGGDTSSQRQENCRATVFMVYCVTS